MKIVSIGLFTQIGGVVVKDGLCLQLFTDYVAVIAAMKKWVTPTATEFQKDGIQALVSRWWL